MQIQVTDNDIRSAERCPTTNPISRALNRLVGGKWYIWYCHMAFEMTPPYRYLRMSQETVHQLTGYLRSGDMQPFQFGGDVEGLPLQEWMQAERRRKERRQVERRQVVAAHAVEAHAMAT